MDTLAKLLQKQAFCSKCKNAVAYEFYPHSFYYACPYQLECQNFKGDEETIQKLLNSKVLVCTNEN